MEGRKLARTAACLRQPGSISLHGAFFSEPRKRLLKDLCRAYIWGHHYPIVHPFAFTASCYDSGATQVGQMPGYLGLRLIQNLNEITDADLLIPHQIQEPKPGIVAESLKKALHVETLVLRLHENNYIRIDECVQQQYSRFTEYVPRGNDDRSIA